METTQGPPDGDGTGRPVSPRLVKRYANRKLYDTRESRYVTLQQIAEYVRDGEDVRIIDNRTKDDLTNVTLAQIIYEEEKRGADPQRALASVQALRQLVQQSGERLFSSLRGGTVGKLMRSREPAGEEGDEAPDDPRWRALTHPREAWEEVQRLADDRVRGLLGYAMGHVQQLQGEVRRLQGRIDRLEAALGALRGSGRGSDEVSSEDEDEPVDGAGGGTKP
ncbi:MAG: polyhydroxyalkanoate synthesis regulator DNA-binding domain-containing protein [Sandaracinaceae bacterium]